MQKRILDLAKSVYKTKAINNSFYPFWMNNVLSTEQLKLFAVNFYEHVAPTVDRIIFSLTRVKNNKARLEILENISDEIGLHGKPHPELLKTFLTALLNKSGADNVDFATMSKKYLIPSTTQLLNEGEKLFSHESVEVSCGALLAQEWHAYPQLVYLYEGARQYKFLFELEEFHENCEYFYIHIGAAEKEHKEQSIVIAADSIKNEAAFDRLAYGFIRYTELLGNYWESLYTSLIELQSNFCYKNMNVAS